MRIFALFIALSMGIEACSAEVVIQTDGFACAPTYKYRGKDLPFEESIWNPTGLTFSCCYLFEPPHGKTWKMCPPEGRIDLKGKVKPGTCTMDSSGKKLGGCVPTKN